MNNTKEGKSTFKEVHWNELVNKMAQSFRMDQKEKEHLKKKSIAKLIGTLPYLADCNDPDRTAATHLGTYILSTRDASVLFHHNENDGGDVFKRLRVLSNFKGGNEKIIKKGISLLALNIISDYKRDEEEDKRLGKYNPITAGVLNFETEKSKLKKDIMSIKCPEIDRILTVEGSADEFWNE